MALDTHINLRMNEADVKRFDERCNEINKPRYTVLRDLITAFNEDRIKIQPTRQQLKSMEIFQ